LAPAALARLLAGFSTSINFTSPRRNANFGSCFTNSSAFSNPELIAFLPAVSLTPFEAASAREVIDGIGGVKAFVMEEGGDKSDKISSATDAPGSYHLTNEEV